MKRLNIYEVEYWIKKGYDETESINLVNKWKKETSCRCKEFWMKRGYSEDESIKIISERQKIEALKQNNYPNKKLSQYSKEYWIKKGITQEDEINKRIEESKIKSNPYSLLDKEKYETMIENRKKTYYSKSEDERKEINKRRGKTKEQLIEKHGYDIAHNMVKTRGSNKKFFRRYSKISESFFDKLQEYAKDKKLIYGYDEKWIRFKDNIGFFVDLVVENENKIIEFNGDFFHANPIRYKKDDIIKIAEKEQYKAYELWNKDEERIKKLKELNYDVCVVWENDVRYNLNGELEKCLKFLKK